MEKINNFKITFPLLLRKHYVSFHFSFYPLSLFFHVKIDTCRTTGRGKDFN